MTSTRCHFCAGTGRTPADYAYGTCQFCAGRGWVVDSARIPTVSHFSDPVSPLVQRK